LLRVALALPASMAASGGLCTPLLAASRSSSGMLPAPASTSLVARGPRLDDAHGRRSMSTINDYKKGLQNDSQNANVDDCVNHNIDDLRVSQQNQSQTRNTNHDSEQVVFTETLVQPTPAPEVVVVVSGPSDVPEGVYISESGSRRPSGRRVTFAEAAGSYYTPLLDESDLGSRVSVPINVERRLSQGWWRPPPAGPSRGSTAWRQHNLGGSSIDSHGMFRHGGGYGYHYGQGYHHQHGKKGHGYGSLICTSFVVFLVLLASCMAALRLLELGFFSPTTSDLPWVANGTARERKTGIKFPLNTVPPGLDDTYVLLGLNLRPAPNGTWSEILGLYVGNHTAEFAHWRDLADAHKDLELQHAMVDSGVPLSLRMVLLSDQSGDEVANLFATEVAPVLQTLYQPSEADALATDLRTLEGWFPPVLHKHQVIWWHWDHQAVRVFLDDISEYPFGSSTLGYALFQSQLNLHGGSLTSLVHFLL